MTTRERLHHIVNDLPEQELDQLLAFVEGRTEPNPGVLLPLHLDEQEATRFLDALDNPDRFEPGLSRLFDRTEA